MSHNVIGKTKPMN